MIGLTKRQREIVDYIDRYLSQNRCSPSYREIQDFFGFSSLGSVYNHIKTLKRKGVLSTPSPGARSLTLIKKESQDQLPLIGKLKGGMPLETFVKPHLVSFPAPPAEEAYLLLVEGDHLLEECLQPNDLAVVVPRLEFVDGEMVIALVEKHTLLVKRAFSEPPYIRFESTNPHVHPLVLRDDHVEIQGVITTVIRNLSESY